MSTKKYNLWAYILGCTALIGAVQYPTIPLFWWLIIGFGSGMLFVYSNSKVQEKKLTFLGIDILNLVLLTILVQTLPSHWGLYLNLVVLLVLFLLLYIKSKIYEKYAV